MNTRWRGQAVIFAGILLAYWAALMLIPVPGFGRGVLTPEGSLPSYIDQKFLPGVLYYKFGDNEGLLSNIPAVCSVLLGVLAGHWLRSNRSGNRKALGLFCAGVACLVCGYAWGMVFPIIKNLWTSSFVLTAGGYSLLLMALFYWVIDVKGYKKWSFYFIVIGVNPLTIYVLQRFVNFNDIGKFFFGGLASLSGQFEPLLATLGVLVIKFLLLYGLYRKKIFLKI